ncbi:hypothetical protein AHAS_Ahas12G0098900 [Arachis hypogaea]
MWLHCHPQRHDSFVIVVTAPSPLHPCKFKPKFCACFLARVRHVESGYSIEFDNRGCLLPIVGLCVLVIPV